MKFKKIYNIFTYVSLGIIALILVFLYMKIIPGDKYLYAVSFVVIILIIKIIFNIFIFIQNRKNSTGG
jgi:energy-coupling factor transporter transmembrane protein EcfT